MSTTPRSIDTVIAARKAQRARALELANQRRIENSKVRRAIKDGTVPVFDMIAARLPDVMDDKQLADRLVQLTDRWTLEYAVRSVPGIGSVKTQEVMYAFRASPRARLGGLSFARRLELAQLVELAARTK